eukprot:CAMPEP_0174262964 /NCGR_PEP_ID=MMETSP0439-20130205/16496_1 /TAXON_ID=0 /ORGANISM="Stereomyxa ramosa, Strain Chinc5" /LENGTH=489 /DNA_ID=CAMNT_0015348043 /DNA_START=134 /DNA_END=1606 /DNA_ORIENTATION=+
MQGTGRKINRKTDRDDPKVIKTLEIVKDLKECEDFFTEIVKIQQQHAKQMLKVLETEKQLTDLLKSLSEFRTGDDLALGLEKVYNYHNFRLQQKTLLLNSMNENLIEGYQKGEGNITDNRQKLITFEKMYKINRDKSIASITKIDKKAQKIAKKGKNPEKLRTLIEDLTKGVKEHDEMLGEELRKVVNMDRQRLSFFMKKWYEVLSLETQQITSSQKLLAEYIPLLFDLTNSSYTQASAILEQTEALIEKTKPDEVMRKLNIARSTQLYPEGLDLSMYGTDDDTYPSPTSGTNSPYHTMQTVPIQAAKTGGLPPLPGRLANASSVTVSRSGDALINRHKHNLSAGGAPVLAPRLPGRDASPRIQLPGMSPRAQPLPPLNHVSPEQPSSPLVPLSNNLPEPIIDEENEESEDSADYLSSDEELLSHAVEPYMVRVRQHYRAQEDDEVSLVVGQIFEVREEVDENWAVATLNNKRGIFPKNHVVPLQAAGQ